jgi:peptidoglycan/xylan/chitin deacetylase (PgdA/CDA1 family)
VEFSISNFSKRYIYSGFLQEKSPILLFHSIKSDKSKNTKNIHEISIENFKSDILWLDKNFDIISLDKFVSLKDKKGKVVITFDDGYLSIFKHALPFLIENKIPSTVFLNGANIDGGILWRDKIRYIIKNKQVDKFYDFVVNKKLDLPLIKDNFYCSSKSPTINSKLLNELIDEFFLINGGYHDSLSIDDTIASLLDLIQSEYVSYGNHGFNHYLMSSLSHKEQLDEVLDNEIYFHNNGIKLSKIFSIPFGGDETYDNNTLDILLKNNYNSILLSRNRLNITSVKSYKSVFIDRFMPQEKNHRNLILIIKMIIKRVLDNLTLRS